MSEMVKNPQHYRDHAVYSRECISYIRDMPYAQASAFKYAFRFLDKGNPMQDLLKARQCLEDLINNNTETFKMDKETLMEMFFEIESFKENLPWDRYLSHWNSTKKAQLIASVSCFQIASGYPSSALVCVNAAISHLEEELNNNFTK